MGVHIRLTYIEGKEYPLDELIQHVKPARYIAAHEIGHNEGKHVHVYLDTKKDVKAIRGWISYRGWKGSLLSVKAWGDKDEDLRYFLKGQPDTRKVHISHSSFSPQWQLEQNTAWWSVADAISNRHKRQKAEKVSLVALLVEQCRQADVSDARGICRVFIENRRGRDQIDPMKHRGIVLSAYAELNKSADSTTDEIVEHFYQKCFY